MKLDHILNEVHHKYTSPDHNTQFDPVKEGDTFTVYHGFNELSTAMSAAKRGISGKSRTSRRYSYEADNNPRGMFITLSFDVAKEFTSQYGAHVIMEFIADYNELEAPVWPGGGYTVQGQMAQTFGEFGNANNRARSARRKEAEAGMNSNVDHVNDSDQKYLADLLTNSSEYQALYVGHVNPNEISAFWVRPGDGLDPRFDDEDKWVRLSPDEFVEQWGEHKYAKPDRNSDGNKSRMFNANDDFDGDEFMSRMKKRFGSSSMDDSLKFMWDDISKKPRKDRKDAFLYYFDNYLWPKQYKTAYRWLSKQHS